MSMWESCICLCFFPNSMSKAPKSLFKPFKHNEEDGQLFNGASALAKKHHGALRSTSSTNVPKLRYKKESVMNLWHLILCNLLIQVYPNVQISCNYLSNLFHNSSAPYCCITSTRTYLDTVICFLSPFYTIVSNFMDSKYVVMTYVTITNFDL